MYDAKEYLNSEYLRENMSEICEALLLETNEPREIMGYPDDLKLCSSMTLFEKTCPYKELFARALGRYLGGIKDERMLEIIISRDKENNPS